VDGVGLSEVCSGEELETALFDRFLLRDLNNPGGTEDVGGEEDAEEGDGGLRNVPVWRKRRKSENPKKNPEARIRPQT
jgi:hypothetical protein